MRDRVGFSLSFLCVKGGDQTAVGAAGMHLLMPVGGRWLLNVSAQILALEPTDVFALPGPSPRRT